MGWRLALCELEDEELEQLLVDHAGIHVILSNTGFDKGFGVWDVRHSEARKRLKKAKVDLQHRMFNNSTHIGHNKFVVHVPPSGTGRSILTGSTNWTSTGLAGQTNNALLVEDDAVAGAFLDYWHRMKKDSLKQPKPLGEPMPANQQPAAFRKSNEMPTRHTVSGGGTVEVWFSPNKPERKNPAPKKDRPTPVLPDLAEVYRRMRLAKEVILFLAFYPGQSGRDCIVGEAIGIGRKDRSLLACGAVSSA